MKTLTIYTFLSCFCLQIIASQEDFVIVPSTNHAPAEQQPQNPVKEFFSAKLQETAQTLSNSFFRKSPKSPDTMPHTLEEQLKQTQQQLTSTKKELTTAQQNLNIANQKLFKLEEKMTIAKVISVVYAIWLWTFF